MKKLLTIISICSIFTLLILFSGCEDKEKAVEKEEFPKIDTGKEDCNDILTSYSSKMRMQQAEIDCTAVCKGNAYGYKAWRCSETNTLECVCTNE